MKSGKTIIIKGQQTGSFSHPKYTQVKVIWLYEYIFKILDL